MPAIIYDDFRRCQYEGLRINITNSAAILTYNQTYNPTPATPSQAWLAPTSVLTPRFFKISAQIDFYWNA